MSPETSRAGNPRATQSIDWNAMLAPYRRPVMWKSLFQLVTTAALLAAFWFAMLWSLDVGYWLTLLLAVPAAFMVVRLFMLQHDCGHGSFFRSQKLNNVVGTVLGVFTLVPYDYWRKTHAIHHATSGNLDLRSLGDIDTLTVKEYLSRSKTKRILYRLYRHPAVMLLDRPDVAVRPEAPPAARHPAQLEARGHQRAGHQPHARGAAGGHVHGGGRQGVLPAAAADHPHRGLDRRLPLLRAAPV